MNIREHVSYVVSRYDVRTLRQKNISIVVDPLINIVK